MTKIKMTKGQYHTLLKTYFERDYKRYTMLSNDQKVIVLQSFKRDLTPDKMTNKNYHYGHEFKEFGYDDLFVTVQVISLMRWHTLNKSHYTINYRDTIRKNYEDCYSQLTMLLLEANYKFLETLAMHGIDVVRQYETLSGQGMTASKETVIESRRIYDFRQLTIDDVWTIFNKKYKVLSNFKKWLFNEYTKSSVNTFTELEEYYITSEDETLSIFETIADNATELKMTNIELLESIKGSLTRSQYSIVAQILDGATYNQLKVGGSVQRGIRTKLYNLFKFTEVKAYSKPLSNFKTYIKIDYKDFTTLPYVNRPSTTYNSLTDRINKVCNVKTYDKREYKVTHRRLEDTFKQEFTKFIDTEKKPKIKFDETTKGYKDLEDETK